MQNLMKNIMKKNVEIYFQKNKENMTNNSF